MGLSVNTNLWSSPLYGMIVGYIRFLKTSCRDWLKNIIDMIMYRSSESTWSARRGITQLLTQDYEGRDIDITIMPWRGDHSVFSAFMSLIKNNSAERFLQIVSVGERNAWPKISRIRAHCSVEVTLDNCVQRLRKRITIENHNKLLTDENEKGLDRTPSFYTSRSIVNLSGLSVSDPTPRLTGKGIEKLQKKNSFNSAHSGSGDKLGNFIEDLYQEDDFYVPVEGRDMMLKGFDGSSDTSDPQWYSRVGKDRPGPAGLVRSKTEPTRSKSEPDSLSRSTSGDSYHTETLTTEQIIDGQRINNMTPKHKTTNMANFYYKKGAKSDENLNASM